MRACAVHAGTRVPTAMDPPAARSFMPRSPGLGHGRRPLLRWGSSRNQLQPSAGRMGESLVGKFCRHNFILKRSLRVYSCTYKVLQHY